MRPVFLIGTPTHRVIEGRTAGCLIDLTAELAYKGHQIAFLPSIGLPVDLARESIVDNSFQVANTLRADPASTYLLFVDSDMEFVPSDVYRLHREIAKSPSTAIMSGAAVRWKKPHEPVMNWKHPGEGLISEEERDARIETYLDDGSAEEVDVIGLGFALVRLSVFADLERPFFKMGEEIDGHVQGEDTYFLRKCQKAGYVGKVHFGVSVGHIGYNVYYPHHWQEERNSIESVPTANEG